MQVRAMNGPGQWSLGPGYFSAWAPTGKRLYLRRLPDFRLVAADYSGEGSTFRVGAVRVRSRIAVDSFDVLPDGRHVVAIPAYADLKDATRATFLVNFMDDLRRRVPPER